MRRSAAVAQLRAVEIADEVVAAIATAAATVMITT